MDIKMFFSVQSILIMPWIKKPKSSPTLDVRNPPIGVERTLGCYQYMTRVVLFERPQIHLESVVITRFGAPRTPYELLHGPPSFKESFWPGAVSDYPHTCIKSCDVFRNNQVTFLWCWQHIFQLDSRVHNDRIGIIPEDPSTVLSKCMLHCSNLAPRWRPRCIYKLACIQYSISMFVCVLFMVIPCCIEDIWKVSWSFLGILWCNVSIGHCSQAYRRCIKDGFRVFLN